MYVHSVVMHFLLGRGYELPSLGLICSLTSASWDNGGTGN
jgi:hypothetical protein